MKPIHATLYRGSALLGLLAIVWVAAGLVHGSATALWMTVAIAVTFGAGVWELHRYRTDTAGLRRATEQLGQGDHAAASPAMADWLLTVPAALQGVVRLRVGGERVAFAPPVLAPYLVGLLVMLGMLGTFAGLILTFGGTVGALEGSADLLAMRTALAAPIKGLGLAFGSSVAGVAASAALGLMLALARRERAELTGAIDELAQTVFGVHTPRHQREQVLGLLSRQAEGWPVLVDRLQSLVDGMAQRDQALQQRWETQQTRFQADMGEAFLRLTEQVQQSLRDGLAHTQQAAQEAARAAGMAVQAPVQQLVDGLQDTMARHQRALDAALAERQQVSLEALGARQQVLLDTLEARMGELITEWQALAQRSDDRTAQADRARAEWQQQLGEWQRREQGDGERQRDALADANRRLVETLTEQADHARQLVDRIGHSAGQVATLGSAFGQGVERFTEASERLWQSLAQVEGALQQSLERSDEQLAYYVGQAREVIDLCLSSQQRVLDDLQRLRRTETDRAAPEVA